MMAVSEQQQGLTNPARRLLSFISKGKTLKPALTAQAALAQMFEVKQDNHAELFERFSVFLKLIEDTELRIKNLDSHDKDRYIQCMSPIRKAFTVPNLATPWNQMISQISDSDIALLDLSSQALDTYQKEALIPENTLEEIKRDTDDLFNQVTASDLDKNLKVILLDLLELIRHSIAEYRIRGAEGLKKAIAESVGRLFIEKEIVVQEKEKSAFKAFWSYLAKVNLIVSSAMHAKEFGRGINDLIQHLLEQ